MRLELGSPVSEEDAEQRMQCAADRHWMVLPPSLRIALFCYYEHYDDYKLVGKNVVKFLSWIIRSKEKSSKLYHDLMIAGGEALKQKACMEFLNALDEGEVTERDF